MKFYNLDTKFNFGKYQGKTLMEILRIQDSYTNWCSINLDHFYMEDEVIIQILEIKPNFKLTEDAKHKLRIKYNEWEHMHNYKNDYHQNTYQREPYGEFAGTYAQDVEGLSDDFINEVLEGDPDAYWNID
jgi:hypothetical protein